MGTLIYHVAVSLDYFIADQAMMEGRIDQTLFYSMGNMFRTF